MSALPKKRSKHYRHDFLGVISASNFADWLVTLLVGANVCYLITQFGGMRPETVWIYSGLMLATLLFGIFVLVLRSLERRPSLNLSALWLLPFVLYLFFQGLLLDQPDASDRAMTGVWIMAGILCLVVMHSYWEPSHLYVTGVLLAIVILIGALLSLNHFYRDIPMSIDFISLANPLTHPLRVDARYSGIAVGTLGLPAQYALFSVMVAAPLMVLALAERFAFSQRAFLGFLLLLSLFTLVLTAYYPAILMAIVLAALTPLLIRPQVARLLRWYFGVILYAAVVLLVLPHYSEFYDVAWGVFVEQGTAGAELMRTVAWQQFLENPLWGSGSGAVQANFETFRPEAYAGEPYFVHNDYVLQLAERGLFGFALLFLPLGYTVLRALRQWASYEIREELPDDKKLKGQKRRRRLPDNKLYLSAFLVFMFGTGGLAWFGLLTETPALLMGMALAIGWYYRYFPLKWVSFPAKVPQMATIGVVGLVLAVAMVSFWPAYRQAIVEDDARRLLIALHARGLANKNTARVITETKALLETAGGADAASTHASLLYAELALLEAHLNPVNRADHATEAANVYEAILERDASYKAWLGLGQAKWLRGDNAAGEAFEQAQALAPNHFATWYYLAAWENALSPGSPAAIAAMEQAVALNPDSAAVAELRRKINLPATGHRVESVIASMPPMPLPPVAAEAAPGGSGWYLLPKSFNAIGQKE